MTAQNGSEVVSRWQRWKDSKAEFVAPLLLKYELANAFHRMRISGEISDQGCAQFLQSSLDLPVTFDDSEQIHFEALQLAALLRLPAAYDAHYLAVARSHNAEFWTFDRRLHQAAGTQFDWVFLAS